MLYRGYWIEQTPYKSLSGKGFCYDIYQSKADVGKINHIDCVETQADAEKTIDDWKAGR